MLAEEEAGWAVVAVGGDAGTVAALATLFSSEWSVVAAMFVLAEDDAALEEYDTAVCESDKKARLNCG